MRNIKNRLLGMLLALAVLAGLVPGAAWASEEPVGRVTFSIETKTIDGGYLAGPEETALYGGDTVFTILSRVAADRGLEVAGADQGYVTRIGAFASAPDSIYGSESGWMVLLNGDYETWPLPALKDGDVVRFCYTYKTYGHDIDLIDLVEGVAERAELARAYVGENAQAVAGALEQAEKLLAKIEGCGSNQSYLDSVGTLVYGPGSDAVQAQRLIRWLDTVLAGLPYVPAEKIEIKVLDSQGNPASEFVAGRRYQLQPVFTPDNASWRDGSWKVVEMGAEAEVSEDGTLTIRAVNNDYYGLHMLTVQFWHPEAMNGCVSKTISGVKGPQLPEDYVALALELLTWDSIRGSNPADGPVTADLELPAQVEVEGKTVETAWSCDDATGALSVSNYSGAWTAYVDRPAAADVSCTLTARLSCEGAETVKTFPVTIKAEGVDENKESVVVYGKLMEGIAAGYGSSADPWTVLDMAAYNASNIKSGDYQDASPAAGVLADGAVGQPDAGALSGVDAAGPYAIYTIPYLSLAYQVCGVEGTDSHSPASLTAAMTAYLRGMPDNGAGVDEAAPVLAALAPYYGKGDSALDGAVDGAVAWLSGQQKGDGTFSYYGVSNANSTALVVVALSALGIDAHTDSRFIKNNRSAMDGLFSFALADHSGFGYKGNVTRSGLSTEQGFRALVAYARFQEAGAPYNIYLQAGESGGLVPAPQISATTGPSGGGGDPQAKVRVSVSVMVPPEGGGEGRYTYRYDGDEYTDLLSGAQSVTVPSGTSVLQVSKSVLDGAGISYAVSGGYFSRIGGLEEGDHGPRSGWQYLVDGTAPTESSETYTFEDDGKLVWYYTDDYTKEKSAESWGGKPAQAEAGVKKEGDGTYSVTLPKGADGPVRVAIPDVGGGQVVVIVHKDGTQEVVKKSLIQDGTAYLLLEADAKLRVLDYTGGFSDVSRDAWYAPFVDFAASRSLFSGVEGDLFAPARELSRGMLVTALYALEDGGAGERGTPFDDVPQGAWYARGAYWASEAGVVSGYGDGRFGPEDAISREQLAVMLYGYAKHLGMDTDGRSGLSGYRDGEDVSSWAREAMGWAVDTGILSGRSGQTLDPAGTATRAEAAAMLRQFVARLVK